MKSWEVSIKTRSTPASLSFKVQPTKHTIENGLPKDVHEQYLNIGQ